MIRDRRVWLPPLILLLAGVALYLPRLGASALWDPWEPRYAQAAREMAASGDWIIPEYRHGERLNKPPMTYWLIACSHSVLGVDETAARLPSALLAVLAAVALGYALAARGRPLEGLLAGGALLSGPQWYLLGRFATPDMPLASFLGIALALALLGPVAGRRGIAIVVLVACAGLADWPRGLLLPLWAALGWAAVRWSWKGPLALAAVAAVYHAAQLSHSVPLNLAAIVLAAVSTALVLRLRVGVSLPVIVIGAVAVALLVAPWFLAVEARGPEEMSLYRYKYAFNLGESIGQHERGYLFALRNVAIGGMPWSALAVIGLIAGVRPGRDETAAVLAGAFVGATLFFTLSAAHLGHFYGVIQPAVAGLAGIGAVELVRRPDWRLAPAVAVLLVTVGLVRDEPSRLLETVTVKIALFGIEPFGWVVAAVAGWVIVLVAAGLSGRQSWTLACVVPAALLSGALGLWLVPELAPKKSTKALWEAYVERRDGAEPLGFLGPSKASAFYYSDNAVDNMGSAEEFRAFLSGPRPKFLIAARRAFRLPRLAEGASWETLHREHPTHWLLRYEPPPEPPETEP